VVRLELPVRKHTVETEATAPRGWHRAGFITSDKSPDTLSITVNGYRRRRPHFPATGKSRPFTSGNGDAASVCQPPDGAVRIVRGPWAKHAVSVASSITMPHNVM